MVGARTRRHTITCSGIGNGRPVNGILRKQVLPQAFPALWRISIHVDGLSPTRRVSCLVPPVLLANFGRHVVVGVTHVTNVTGGAKCCRP